MEINRTTFLAGSLAVLSAALTENVFSAEAPGSQQTGTASPERLLGRLMAGNQRFVESDFPTTNHIVEKRELLLDTQAPFAAILGCADSRVIPNLVFVQGLGDLFVTRVAGNFPDDLVTGSIEYAVEHLGTRLIMVLGHQNCGAIKAVYSAIESKQPLPPHLSAIQRLIAPGITSVVRAHGSMDAAVKANVRAAEEALQATSPVISEAVKSGRVLVTGGVYQLGSGKVTLTD